MDNKLNNMLNEFFANNEFENEEEANKKLQEFIMKYNNNEIEYENTKLDDAYEILEKAQNAKSPSKAIKYAEQAYETCKECLDALLFRISLEDDPLKSSKLLNEGLEYEKDRLTKEGYFKKDNIGHFYAIFETRQYIKGLYTKAMYLTIDGKIKQARDVCKEIIRLNSNDNSGSRYLLMAIYAYLEEESEILKLYRKYPEDTLGMLVPLFILYYKLGKDDKAIEYLKKVNKANPNFLKYFKEDELKPNKKIPEGCYAFGDASEVLNFIDETGFLLDTVPTISYYIIENSKTK